MDRSNKYLLFSMVFVFVIALIWLRAPILPTIVGVFGAGMLLYWYRQRGQR